MCASFVSTLYQSAVVCLYITRVAHAIALDANPLTSCLHTCIVTRYLGHPHRPGVRLARYLRQDQACMCVCIQSTDDSHVFESHISMTFMYACMYIPRHLMASGEGSLDDSERPAQTSFDDVAQVGTLPSLPAGILCTVHTSIHCLIRLDISPRAL